MKKNGFLFLSLWGLISLSLGFASSALFAADSKSQAKSASKKDQAKEELMTLTSTALSSAQGEMANDQVFNGFGCQGKNISPDLTWANAPKGTKSFALTAYDPDAPTGSGWWHWTLFNIAPSVTSIELGANQDDKKLPKGSVQGLTDFGKPGYGGACPPVGDKPHHYIFTVYALKVEKLDLAPTATGAMVGYYLNQNALSKASLTVTYQHKK